MPPSFSARRMLLLSVMAAAIGLVAGGAAFLLIHAIGLLTNVALFGRVAVELPSFENLAPSPRLVIVPMIGGLLVALIARWVPLIKGHGIPEAMEAVLRRSSRIQPRAAVAKPLSAAIAIGTGGPFGAEGPIIVTGGAIGSLLGQVVDVSPSERKILLASGAAAGMAATFGAPLAAVILAIELLLFEFSTRAFIPLVVATALAAGVHSAAFGSGPLFTVGAHEFAGLAKLPFYAVLGVACGLLAVLICKGLFAFEHGWRRLPVSDFWHPMIGALGFGLIGLLVPRALGVGYDAIDDVLAGSMALDALTALLVAKLLAWWIALSSGTSGGTLAPVLLVSGAFGALVGTVLGDLLPALGLTAGAFAVVAMAATFGAATRATFTAIVFLFELTRDYEIILPLMLASVLADLVAARLLGSDSLLTEKLTRRGIRVGTDYQADVLTTTTVGDVMTCDVQTMEAGVTLAEAAERLAGAHSAYPLMDGETCVGMVTRTDVLREDAKPDTPVESTDERDVVAVSPDAAVLLALQLMLDEAVDHLPVLDDDGRLVGICTRTDVLRARHRHLLHERRERGWLSPRLRRPAATRSSNDGEP